MDVSSQGQYNISRTNKAPLPPPGLQDGDPYRHLDGRLTNFGVTPLGRIWNLE